jgi:hypothetical protein
MSLNRWARRARARRLALLPALVAALAAGAQAGAARHPDHDPGGMPARGWHPSLAHHMGDDMPDAGAATPRQLAFARRLMRRTLRRTARYATPARARSAGYRPSGRLLRPGIRHFNSRAAESDGRILDARRPESLLFWRTPDGSRQLVAAMFRAPSVRPPPRMHNPLLRWHAHYRCGPRMPGHPRQLPLEHCPKGTVAHYGMTQMLHVWFTGDLMTAYAVDPPITALKTALGIR